MKAKTLKQGVFITGTDTEVGKTYIGVRLVQALSAKGLSVSPRKPVESGCKLISGARFPADAHALWQAAERKLPLREVCPHKLVAPLSPERAAHQEGIELNLQQLVTACQAEQENFLLVEGAGGFYSPLVKDGLNVDLARQLALPVVIVAANKLGCINHSLLTAMAINHGGLILKAVILNDTTPYAENGMDNAEDLRSRLDCPVIPVAYNGNADDEGIIQLAELLGMEI